MTFLWKIGVKIGNKPLVIAPLVSAEDSALIGAQPLIVSRKAGVQTGFAAEVQRAEIPIYELDDEEQIEHEAANAALAAVTPEAEYRPPMEPPLQPTPPPDQPGEPIPPPSQPVDRSRTRNTGAGTHDSRSSRRAAGDRADRARSSRSLWAHRPAVRSLFREHF